MGEPWVLRKGEIVNLTVREILAFYSERKKGNSQLPYKVKFFHVVRHRYRDLPPEDREARVQFEWRNYCLKNGLAE